MKREGFQAEFPRRDTMRDVIAINRPSFGREEMEGLAKVVRSGIVTNKSGSGPLVTEFEARFSRYVGAKYGVAVNSGTAALHAALLALNIGRGDEVIVPSFSFVATAEAVALTGARPVFIDIDPRTYTLNPQFIDGIVTQKTKAIIVVHLFGLMANMAHVNNAAKRLGLPVIEDAAQAHGAECKGKKAGSTGQMGCFSFYASKNMTTGEGGMVTTSDPELVASLKNIRNHGETRPYFTTRLGHNYRMTELQAAMGLAQLSKLPAFLKKRKRNAGLLSERLSANEKLSLPYIPEGFTHGWNLYTARLRGFHPSRRNKIVEKLRKRSINVGTYYETPIHLNPFYRDATQSPLEETETACHQVLQLPIHPLVTEEDLRYIVKNVSEIIT
ncbi:MAG TPA: DegT/DnrJ/EryC1/StrS family aminotransferase [Candidatus Bathyarchaeia archaeon]|nr:DegT/DnrJ/EryC1/StrS family aminotransferase [Candidatus Bathyarchaeia archaeon]